MNDSEISIGIYEIYDVWNESDIETVSEKKLGKYLRSFLSDDDRSLSVSTNFYKNFKENIPNHKRKHNLSLNSWYEVNTKKLSILWLITSKNRGIIQNPVRMVKNSSNLNI